MADHKGFLVELVTPERILREGWSTQVVLRTADGDATFLDGHTPLVGSIVPGAVRITDEDGAETVYAVHGGYVQVEKGGPAPEGPEEFAAGAFRHHSGTRVTLLAPVAEAADDIDVERAQRAKDAATATVERLGGSGAGASGGDETARDPELVEAEGALARAEVRLSVAGAAEG